MAPELVLGVVFAAVLAVLFMVALVLALPIRIDVPLTQLATGIDRLAVALGLLDPCPSCGVPAEELGRQGDRVWLYCPACGRNPWRADDTGELSSDAEVAS